MEALDLILISAAFVAGLTGTWSPCGFSMIETVGPTGHTGGRTTTLSACATFAVGALAGGVLTFAGLALAGALVHGAAGSLALGLGAAVALAGAALEARGARILPQVRRQLPEHWRRLMPMPLAAGLYGVLLGLGFTTFVLTFGVFALAGVSFAVAEPILGIEIGVAFGAGRALPVVVLAPLSARRIGIAATELMAERPSILRGFRLADAAALLVAGLALATTAPAGAAKLESSPAADPTLDAGELAYQRPDRSAHIRRGGEERSLPGRDPALGDGRLAVIEGERIAILDASSLEELGRFDAPGADALAVSERWVAWRARSGERDLLRARSIENPARPGAVKQLGKAGGAAQLGRPSLDGNRLVYARATKRKNVIAKRLLGGKGGKGKATLLRSRTVGLSNPSILGGHVLYVRHDRRADQLRLVKLRGSGNGRTLLSRRGGTLWSTELGRTRAYVTHIHGTEPRQKIISAKR